MVLGYHLSADVKYVVMQHMSDAEYFQYRRKYFKSD